MGARDTPGTLALPLVPQSDQRVHARGPSGRQITGQQRERCQRHGRGAKRQRVQRDALQTGCSAQMKGWRQPGIRAGRERAECGAMRARRSGTGRIGIWAPPPRRCTTPASRRGPPAPPGWFVPAVWRKWISSTLPGRSTTLANATAAQPPTARVFWSFTCLSGACKRRSDPCHGYARSLSSGGD